MPPPPAHAAETAEPLIGATFACVPLATPTGLARVMVVGELDLVTADRARKALRRAQDEARELICDLGDVWFVDLSGLRVLLDAAAHARATGGRLTLANCPPVVPRMLRLLRLEDALEIQGLFRSVDSHCCAATRRG